MVAIATTDKKTVTALKRDVKDEKSLQEALKKHTTTTQSMNMDDRPQAMFPPEMVEAILKAGEGTLVGPFVNRGASMLFYVTKIKDAKKREFTQEMAEMYIKGAIKDFMQEYMKEQYEKNSVKFQDVLSGKTYDPFELPTSKATEQENEKAAKALSKVKNDQVLAYIKDEKIMVSQVLELYKVKSLTDDIFLALAKQFSIPLNMIVRHALKLIVDEKLLYKLSTDEKYQEKPEVAAKLLDVENLEYQHAYYKAYVKVTNADVRRTFDKFIQSIPDDEKNDHELAVRIAFYKTQEDATAALKTIQKGEKKFADIFNEKDRQDPKECVDLGYIRKASIPPEIWGKLKTNNAGTCFSEILQMDGAQFGISEYDYAMVYIADRRPVQLPSLSTAEGKKQFQRKAERDKAVEIALQNLKKSVKKINGKDLSEYPQQYQEQVISGCIGYSG
jgi:hypothetical protein